ncbi:hypothetical protein [Macrococcoides caseolyticum]|uniref:Uncharacterized protein n=1 Tax=Macrococcoides caseolyticum TaxID=69966 RepID=A0ACC9MTX4_9STAP|nr:hypothetical protein [Macrococcus caseolyticus]PKE20252.1 hypothetical protein CW679_02900 [Macrococcus caseolyticus]PKE35018.1 hypothetical protein CW695_10570 [Macrococcus caseolyticus]PKE40109.1 hypothetical protein CW675_04010 [Macrococcus caseolyticus]PKE57257.1 hypothetical protein CW682_03355 [Macrococcus caseolyticus]PKE73676.1 hypothetical protein CW670_10750 [Macrococcus caseolyticus]
MNQYVGFNQERWNNVSKKKGNAYSIPLSHEEFIYIKNNPIDVSLTIGKSVPNEWFTKAKGNKLSSLA